MASRRITLFIAGALIPVFLLAACADKPYTVEPRQINDPNLNCAELEAEIRKAEGYKDASRDQDNFQFKYILIVPAMVAMYQWTNAEKAAQERIDLLSSYYDQRNCQTLMRTPAYGLTPGLVEEKK